MNEIEILLAQTYLSANISRLSINLDELKEKHPSRKDYIETMQKVISELVEVKAIFTGLEKNYRKRENCFDYALIIANLQKENDELKNKNKELIELL